MRANDQEEKANLPNKLEYQARTMTNLALILAETGREEESIRKYEDIIKVGIIKTCNILISLVFLNVIFSICKVSFSKSDCTW